MGSGKGVDFHDTFHALWAKAEGRKPSPLAPPPSKAHPADPAASEDTETAPKVVAPPAVPLTPEERKARLQAMKGSSRRGGKGGAGSGSSGSKKGKGPKKPRKWADSALTAEEVQALDAAAGAAGGSAGQAAVEEVSYSGDGTGSDVSKEWDVGAAHAEETGWWTSVTATSASWLGSLTGSTPLTQEAIAPAMDTLREHLLEKNVARDIAQELCDSVATSLVGVVPGTFTSVPALVRDALGAAIRRKLTARSSIDVLAAANAKAATGGASAAPYTIVFIGVNGVGKSTSLAKVVYYLKDNGKQVLIAACDTFRAGAVEQLKRHAKALKVPLFERGYEKDSAAVAAAAVKHGAETGHDVVVVDTAGRMQNNDKLMVELAALVDRVQPDLVLFVGEALVGNDGVDQLQAFHRALQDHSRSATPRGIDGIVLTKFDTIDDKVGASLSMVYRTGVPVVFVGTGQKHTNLRKLNVDAVVEALLA